MWGTNTVDKSVRKRIALLLGQAEESSQTRFIEGFLSAAFANDHDVLIFSTFIKYQNTPEREIGEISIFNLPDWKKFDAVVVLADTIQTPGAMDKIEKDLHENYDGEVVFIEKDSSYYRTYRMDNYTSVRKLVDHLIDGHGYKDIAFLTGKSWHPHSGIRLKAYRDSMEAHGISVDEDRIFYGDFWYTSGESLADTLMASERALPQALVCANDCMAIGFAKEISARGLKIPDDIAVVGYDTNEEGQHAPVPLTSAPVPMKEFGQYVAAAVKEILDGKEPEPFKADVSLFIGGSCGCGCDSAKTGYILRDSWDTEISKATVFSLFNYMDDDLLSQTSFTGLISTIFSYVYQIRDFEDFAICLNENIRDGVRAEKTGSRYTGNMIPVIRCGPVDANRDRLDFENTFPVEEMLPSVFEDRDHPAAWYFFPLNFDDHVFGYSAISYGNRPVGASSELRAWLKSASRGLEYFRRSDEFIRSHSIIETGIIRDNLTGLYNYQGFVRQAETFIHMVKNNGNHVGVLVADIKDLAVINREFGRAEGDKAIIEAAGFLEGTFRSRNSMCLCVGNGELVAVRITSSNNSNELMELRDAFLAKLAEHNQQSGAGYSLEVYCAIESGSPATVDDLERMVNIAIAKKNNIKFTSNKISSEDSLSEIEMEEARQVQSILDDARLSYHFQPIIRADTGEIFAYEALMRPDTEGGLSPLKILKYAEYLGRLSDVERATFDNVLRILNEKKDVITKGRKIFINSIPGHMIKAEALEELISAVGKSPDSIVVELTEHAEVTDEELDDIKNVLSEAGVQIAVDDYGTGYSNVANLLRYMPDYVKIDRQLLSDIQDSPQKQHFVKDIIEFSHDNGILALAEGVETPEELKTVLELDVDFIQGYYIAKPEKQLISEIDPDIVNEIIKQPARHRYPAGTYCAGKDSRINLANLAKDKFNTIVLNNVDASYKDYVIVGAPGVTIPMQIKMMNGYSGRVTLENVDIEQTEIGAPAITVTGNSYVTIALKGASYLEGGIKVDEQSKLALEGDGFLSIGSRNECPYAIGNDFDSRHGDLVFNQDGTVTIKIDAKSSIGIGSGLGGRINIKRGRYLIGLKGRNSVGIGCGKGNAKLSVKYCNIDMEYQGRYGVGIGSLSGDADIEIKNSKIMSVLTGEVITGIGSLSGNSANINIDKAYINMSGRGSKFCGIGMTSECCDGADISISYTGVSVRAEGSKSLALGSIQMNSRLNLSHASFAGSVSTGLASAVGASDEGRREDDVIWEIKS